MAPGTGERASFQIDAGTDSRPIMNREVIDIHHDALPLSRLKDSSIQDEPP
jgi:hypothetical protein